MHCKHSDGSNESVLDWAAEWPSTGTKYARSTEAILANRIGCYQQCEAAGPVMHYLQETAPQVTGPFSCIARQLWMLRRHKPPS